MYFSSFRVIVTIWFLRVLSYRVKDVYLLHMPYYM